MPGHKLHAPKEIGVLSDGTKIRPLLIGGHQEGTARRSGRRSLDCVSGLESRELAAKNMEKENTYVKKHRISWRSGAFKRIPQSRVNGDTNGMLPNTRTHQF